MSALRSLAAEDWFQLGDGDLALHVLRSQALAQGQTLSQVTGRFAAGWSLQTQILPMSDYPVSTILITTEGELGFQDYFVRLRCAPTVKDIRFDGAGTAKPEPGVLDAIADARCAILIAPSNPP